MGGKLFVGIWMTLVVTLLSPNLVVFETESHSVAQAGHEVIVVLSQSLEF